MSHSSSLNFLTIVCKKKSENSPCEVIIVVVPKGYLHPPISTLGTQVPIINLI